MPVKAILLDVSGTILSSQNEKVAGIDAMLERLYALGIEVFFSATKDPEINWARRLYGWPQNRCLSYNIVGKGKGKQAYVQHVCNELAINRNEILYLGDGDSDMHEAVNSDVIFFLASWSNPGYGYGIPVATPEEFVDIVETFFLKEHLWYYRVNSKDSLGRDVTVRSLLNPDVAKQRGITDLLKSKGARGRAQIGHYWNDQYLSFHLLASIYLEGLHLPQTGKPFWCIYPSSNCTYTGLLDQFLFMISRQFHDNYKQDLILRHKPSIKSSSARYHGGSVTIDNQLQTIIVNTEYQRTLTGACVIVIDDFTTYSLSFETARNFLLNAGAQSVVCIAVGKYPKPYRAYMPNKGTLWNSFIPTDLTGSHFQLQILEEQYDDEALENF